MSGKLSREGYLPALRFRRLTRFFDPLMATLFDEAPLRERLIAPAQIVPGHRVLDLGCGTGTLLVQLKKRQPDTIAVGRSSGRRARRPKADTTRPPPEVARRESVQPRWSPRGGARR